MFLEILFNVLLFYAYLCGIKFLKYDEYIKNKTTPTIGKLLDVTMKISGVDNLYTYITRYGLFGKEKQLSQLEKDLVKTTEKLRNVQLNNFKDEENLTEDDFTIVVKDTDNRLINNENYVQNI